MRMKMNKLARSAIFVLSTAIFVLFTLTILTTLSQKALALGVCHMHDSVIELFINKYKIEVEI